MIHADSTTVLERWLPAIHEDLGDFASAYAKVHPRTAIFISHRFSTVRRADRILVFEEGSLIESGTHEELLALGGVYAELFNLQAASYR